MCVPAGVIFSKGGGVGGICEGMKFFVCGGVKIFKVVFIFEVDSFLKSFSFLRSF